MQRILNDIRVALNNDLYFSPLAQLLLYQIYVVRTLDLDKDFTEIKKQLDGITERFLYEKTYTAKKDY